MVSFYMYKDNMLARLDANQIDAVPSTLKGIQKKGDK